MSNTRPLLKPVNDAYAAMEAKEKGLTDEQKNSPEYKRLSWKTEKAIDAKEKAITQKFIHRTP
jgi:CHASE3 domain sensor protein